jgi:hypothetical protein
VAEGSPGIRRESLVAEARVLELERHARHPQLHVGREAEIRSLIVDLFQVQLRVAGQGSDLLDRG